MRTFELVLQLFLSGLELFDFFSFTVVTARDGTTETQTWHFACETKREIETLKLSTKLSLSAAVCAYNKPNNNNNLHDEMTRDTHQSSAW
jgi:hypothetical protein